MGPEAKIEAKFRKEVLRYGGIAFKFVSPGYSGVSDRLVLLPGGDCVFTEIKTMSGKLTPLQLAFERVVAKMGGRYEVIRCEEDIKQFIEKYFLNDLL